jgi:hypothetical protein
LLGGKNKAIFDLDNLKFSSKKNRPKRREREKRNKKNIFQTPPIEQRTNHTKIKAREWERLNRAYI